MYIEKNGKHSANTGFQFMYGVKFYNMEEVNINIDNISYTYLY